MQAGGGGGGGGGFRGVRDEGSWRHLSDGTPYLTTGRTEFAEMDGFSLQSERRSGFFGATFLRHCWRAAGVWLFCGFVVVLLAFSNRCLFLQR